MKTLMPLLLFAITLGGTAQQQRFTNPSKRPIVFLLNKGHQQTKQTSSPTGLKDSTHLYLLEFVSNTYTMDRTIYSYNSAGKENYYITYRQTPTQWQQIGQSVNYSYDSNNNLLSVTRQYFDISSSTWINSIKVDATYNSSNDKLSETVQSWNGSAWINNNRGVFTYNSNHAVLTMQGQMFNTTTSQWENDRYYTYGYDANGNMILDLTQGWDAATSSWVNQTRNSGTFNSNNEYVTYISESWNGTTQQWENSARLANTTYVNGDLTYYEVENWTPATQYTLSFKVVMNYDGNHNVLDFMSQTYNTVSGLWENTDKDDYTYDSNNNQTAGLFYMGDQNGTTWKNFQRQYDYYSSAVGIKELNSKENLIQLYPNPVKDVFTINSNDNFLFTEISLTDVSGKTVLIQALNDVSTTTLDVSELPAGIYIVQMKAANAVIHKKIIKE